MRYRTTIKPMKLIRYAEGEVTRSQAMEIEEQIADDPTQQRHLAQIKELTEAIHADDEETTTDMVPRIMTAIADAKPRQKTPVLRFRRLWVPAAATVCAVFAFGLTVQLHSPATDSPSPQSEFLVKSEAPASTDFRVKSNAPASADFRVKSDAPASTDFRVKSDAPVSTNFRVKSDAPASTNRSKWIGLSVYHTKNKQQPPMQLGEKMHPNDGLLFSYTNLGPQPFKYLMIFAVSGTGDIYWYYPEFLRAGTDPTAIPIRGGVKRRELPQLIYHQLATDTLTIYGLFADQPLAVSFVERKVIESMKSGKALPGTLGNLPISEAGQFLVQTRVAL